MRRIVTAILLVAVLVTGGACVDVPDSVRAQFAAPGASDRSNFRRGTHGSAPPNEDPAPKAAESRPVGELDAGAHTSDVARVDGGTP